ncbi:MAG TPA: tetratricopeptide repeat protein [Verrucomicrobiae bacterium]|jgi:hypothetical protein|nr:tetratricopeptide repeat protein [Verrucomicrobiae bacterium]
MKKLLSFASLSAASWLAGVVLATAATPSELLEQGIYSEETKGDLPGAVQIYQQVVSEAKASQALAAQAQYHLGVCYYKQQDYTNATAAFETLTKDYPDQKDLVALAQKYLSGANALQPVPWQDGEDLRLDLKLPGGLKVGFIDYAIDAGEYQGQKIWRPSSHILAGETRSFSWSEVEADSFKPLRSRWMHSLLSDVETTYFSDHADLKTAGKDGSTRLDFSAPVIDNEECVEWMRRLPLTAGEEMTQPILASLGNRVLTVKFLVSGPEPVEVPAGTFQCYKVHLSINQDFWYSADARHYLVKFEAGGAVGVLRQISHRAPGAPVSLDDPAAGVSLTAPAGWCIDDSGFSDGKGSIALLDPTCQAQGELTIKTVSLIEETNKTDLAALARHGLSFRAQMRKNFVTRPASFTNQTAGALPTLGFLSDYDEGSQHRVMYSAFILGATNAFAFDFSTSPKDFDALRPKFDTIVSSLQEK